MEQALLRAKLELEALLGFWTEVELRGAKRGRTAGVSP